MHSQTGNHRAFAPIAAGRLASQVFSYTYSLIGFLSALAIILAPIGLSSCGVTSAGSGGHPGASTGVLSESATSVSFGNVAVGSNKTQSVTVTNTGTATVNVSEAAITGAGYTVIGGSPSTSIPVGQSSTIQIQLAPTSAGADDGSLSVLSDASNSPLTISLAGTGTEPMLGISPASVDFGNVKVGRSSTQTVKLTNNGNVDLVVNLAQISGNGFGMSGLSLPATISSHQSVSFSVQFTPPSAKGMTGSITFTDNVPDSPQTLSLAGAGTAANATLNANPGSIAFGSVAMGSSSTQSITLTNSGTSRIAIFQASASGTGFSSDLSATTLNAGQSTSFIARFAPASTGGASGAITITSNATNATMLIALSGTGTQGSLGANPSSVNFGNRLLGSSATVPITLTNSGTSGVAISQATASGAGFSISGLVPMTLNAGQSTSFTATFVPTTAGAVTGSVSISSNAPGSPLTIALSGGGTQAQPQLTINPASVAFGNVAVGSSAPQNVTLTNSGNGSLNITGVTPSGTGFSFTGLTTQTINAGASVTFPVKFSPASAGSATGSISISSNAPGSLATIALSGTGVQGQLTANPANFNFGNVLVGSKGSQTITLTNGGSASVAISGGSGSGAGYSISGLSATTLNPGESTAFTAQFSPSGVGAASGSISITSNAPNSSLTISLSGTGIQPQLGANPSSASFGNVIIGNSNSQTINLTNGGTAAVSISQANVSGAGFSISGLPTLPMTINPGVSATFNAVFTPTATGSVTGSISVVSNTPNSSLAIPLSGTGLSATHLLSASPTSLSFSNVNVGSSNSLSVTLTNTGNSNVTISAVTASGAGFDASGASGTTLAPTQAATLNVTFAPSVAGAVSGSVGVASNATNSPAIALSGTGVQQVSHSAVLTWTASTSSGVVGYNIYRSTVSGGPYVILDSAAVSADTYTDSSVQSGTTYFYVVRSVDSTGTESVNSSQVQATIP